MVGSKIQINKEENPCVASHVQIRNLGLQPYLKTWRSMQKFTQQRTACTVDELWFVEHYPVFTQGHSGMAHHLLDPENIPVIYSDRGGQITYHAPGQQILYWMLDLHRRKMNVHKLIHTMEQTIIATLTHFNIKGRTKQKAPGIYVGACKIASFGLRITQGFSLHGLALNVSMDLKPFSQINPCGDSKLSMTQIADWYPHVCLVKVRQLMQQYCLYYLES